MLYPPIPLISQYFCLQAVLQQLKLLFFSRYYIFDCPGQIELYTHHKSLANVLQWIAGKKVDIKLTAVHLVDSTYCSDANRFISVLMTSLATMMHMELPHVNLLSKMDLAEKYGELVNSIFLTMIVFFVGT